MAQLASLNGIQFLIERANKDLRQSRIIANDAVLDPEVVVYRQLKDVIADYQNGFVQEELDRQNSDNSITSAYLAADAAIRTTIGHLQVGISKFVTVAARVTSLQSLHQTIPAINIATTFETADPSGWVLVDAAPPNHHENGIYYAPQGTGLSARVSEVGSLTAGTQIYINGGTYDNTIWMVPDGEVTEGGFVYTLVIPWVSPQDLLIDSNSGSQFLSRAGNRKLHAEINPTYLTVQAGALSWSTELINWKTALDSNINGLDTTTNSLLGDLTSVESTLADKSYLIDSLAQSVTQQTTNLQTLTSNYTIISSGLQLITDEDNRQNAAFDLLESDVSAVIAVNNTQNSAITALQSGASTQQSSINSIQSDVSGAISVNGTQDTAITALQSIVLIQSNNIALLEQDLDTRASVSEILSQIVNFKRATSLVRTLENGIFANGITTFSINLGTELAALPSGGVFRVVSFNGAITPYTQSGEPIVNYPNGNIEVVIVSTNQVPDGEIEIALEAFFR